MPRIYGNRIMLREYRHADLDWMRKWVNDPEVVDHLSDIFLFPQTFPGTQHFLESMLEGKSETKGFVIADCNTEEYIGQIDLIKIDWKNRSAKLGIVIGAPGQRGRGYGSEALMLLEEFVFQRLNLDRLELDVHDFNRAALRCYEKCGFKEEGRIRQSYFIHGQYTDLIIMGILKEEYLKLTAGAATLGEASWQEIFPEPILRLPEADIPLPGIKAYLSQGENHQVIFMEFPEDVELAPHSHEAQWGIVLEGRIDLRIDGVFKSYTKGERYFIPAGVEHSGQIHAGYADITYFQQKDRYTVKKRG